VLDNTVGEKARAVGGLAVAAESAAGRSVKAVLVDAMAKVVMRVVGRWVVTMAVASSVAPMAAAEGGMVALTGGTDTPVTAGGIAGAVQVMVRWERGVEVALLAVGVAP